jgi:hypothetical protein
MRPGCVDLALAIIHEDEVVAGAVPFAERDGHAWCAKAGAKIADEFRPQI